MPTECELKKNYSGIAFIYYFFITPELLGLQLKYGKKKKKVDWNLFWCNQCIKRQRSSQETLFKHDGGHYLCVANLSLYNQRAQTYQSKPRCHISLGSWGQMENLAPDGSQVKSCEWGILESWRCSNRLFFCIIIVWASNSTINSCNNKKYSCHLVEIVWPEASRAVPQANVFISS